MSKERQEYYNQAQNANKDATNIYRNEVKSAEDKYNQLAETNTGAQGYNQSLDLATQGAGRIASAAANQAQNAYRKAGVNKAQAAQLAGNQAFNSMAGNIQNQQGQTSGQLANQLNAQTTSAALAGNRASGLQSAGQAGLNTYQNNQQGIMNNVMGWTNYGGQLLNAGAQLAGSFLPSDERTKESINLNCKKIDDILGNRKNKRDFKNLVLSDEDTKFSAKLNGVSWQPMQQVEQLEQGEGLNLDGLSKSLFGLVGSVANQKGASDKANTNNSNVKTTIRTY